MMCGASNNVQYEKVAHLLVGAYGTLPFSFRYNYVFAYRATSDMMNRWFGLRTSPSCIYKYYSNSSDYRRL